MHRQIFNPLRKPRWSGRHLKAHWWAGPWFTVPYRAWCRVASTPGPYLWLGHQYPASSFPVEESKHPLWLFSRRHSLPACPPSWDVLLRYPHAASHHYQTLPSLSAGDLAETEQLKGAKLKGYVNQRTPKAGRCPPNNYSIANQLVLYLMHSRIKTQARTKGCLLLLILEIISGRGKRHMVLLRQYYCSRRKDPDWFSLIFKEKTSC